MAHAADIRLGTEWVDEVQPSTTACYQVPCTE